MSDPNELNLSPVVVQVDGNDVTLKLLSNTARMRLLFALYKVQREAVKSRIVESGIDDKELIYATLEAFDNKERNVNTEWSNYCDQPTDDSIIFESLKMTYGEEKAKELADKVLITFAQKIQIMGLRLKNPPPPPVYPPNGEGLDPETGRPFTYGDTTATMNKPSQTLSPEPLPASTTNDSTSNTTGPTLSDSENTAP